MARKETVTRVIDGDTLETASRKHSVRLANVNAPETGTSGASGAKKQLEKLVLGKDLYLARK